MLQNSNDGRVQPESREFPSWALTTRSLHATLAKVTRSGYLYENQRVLLRINKNTLLRRNKQLLLRMV